MSESDHEKAPSRILVVEDEESVCAFLDEALRAHGFDVVCAQGDQAAYDALRREWRSFSVLLVDINLGEGTTGFDVARFARRLDRNVPVIFMSGGSKALVEKFGVPGSAMIAKPFDIPQLLSVLQGSRP